MEFEVGYLSVKRSMITYNLNLIQLHIDRQLRSYYLRFNTISLFIVTSLYSLEWKSVVAVKGRGSVVDEGNGAIRTYCKQKKSSS